MPISITTRTIIPAPPSPHFHSLMPADPNRTYLRIKNDTAAFIMYFDTAHTFSIGEPNMHVLHPHEVMTLYGEEAGNPWWVFSKWLG